ncbi:MAG: hypothetical protein NTW54_05850 [Bacteroidetes bacterium]|nr:hypothetical protein [Bacteroidota bacterium]
MYTLKNQWPTPHFKAGRSILFSILFTPFFIGNCTNSIKESEPISFSKVNLSVSTFRNGDAQPGVHMITTRLIMPFMASYTTGLL